MISQPLNVLLKEDWFAIDQFPAVLQPLEVPFRGTANGEFAVGYNFQALNACPVGLL